MPSSFSLRIDYRENRGGDIISRLKSIRDSNSIINSSKYDMKIENLTVGDFVIYCGSYVLIIERKTLEDLSASIIDRRIYKNHEKLMETARMDTGLTIRIMYLIEGRRPNPESTKKCGSIPETSLLAKLNHLMMEDGCHIEWTRSSAETADRIIELGKNMMSIKTNKPSADITGGIVSSETNNVDNLVTRSFEVSKRDVQISILACIHTVGYKTAKKLLESDTLVNILTGSADLSLANKRVRRAILEFSDPNIDTSLVEESMLSNIKGVSVNISRDILKSVPFSALITEADIDSVANIKRPNGRRIGPAIAKKVLNVFRDDCPDNSEDQ